MGHRALIDRNAGYLAQLTARSPVLTGGSIAYRLFELSVRPSATHAAPALTTCLHNHLARRPGCSVSSGCCVDPLRPQEKADVQTNENGMKLGSAYGQEQTPKMQIAYFQLLIRYVGHFLHYGLKREADVLIWKPCNAEALRSSIRWRPQYRLDGMTQGVKRFVVP